MEQTKYKCEDLITADFEGFLSLNGEEPDEETVFTLDGKEIPNHGICE